MEDDLTEEQEDQWCADQRQAVVAYLMEQGHSEPNVGDWPAWHIAPIIAVWAVESQSRPGSVGWWAVSGDMPTDYATCGDQRHPRQALHDIGKRWCEAAEAWSNGQRHESITIGTSEQEQELAPMLKARGKLMIEWAADDKIWAN